VGGALRRQTALVAEEVLASVVKEGAAPAGAAEPQAVEDLDLTLWIVPTSS
jgi:hypothetical protein